MSQLIQALQIFLKYQDVKWPTHCEHDVMLIMGITHDEVSEEDRAALETLGFHWGDPIGGESCWYSFRYGSA